jgi:electron transfer flavoprotein alpha subunit
MTPATGAGLFGRAGLGRGAPMVAVVVVRGGQLPLGGDEAVAEAGGTVVLAGSGTEAAAMELLAARRVRCAELGDFAPGAWAVALAPLLAPAAVVLLPASPDGRDLAPRLAHVLGRPLLAGATEVGQHRAVLVRRGGLVSEVHRIDGPVVATLVPGVRGVAPRRGGAVPEVVAVESALAGPDARARGVGSADAAGAGVGPSGDAEVRGGGPGDRGPGSIGHAAGGRDAAEAGAGARTGDEAATTGGSVPTPGAVMRDAAVVEVVPPDPATVDLADARRIVAGGAGLGGPEPFVLLERVAVGLGAAFGATRVASDVGWAPHDRYIGTTGVAVDPDLYVALGISGAVQHVTGLGQPRHVVAVNTDASAPMMALADLAIVTDARALLTALAARLGVADGAPGDHAAGGDDAGAGSGASRFAEAAPGHPAGDDDAEAGPDATTTDRSGVADAGT